MGANRCRAPRLAGGRMIRTAWILMGIIVVSMVLAHMMSGIGSDNMELSFR